MAAAALRSNTSRETASLTLSHFRYFFSHRLHHNHRNKTIASPKPLGRERRCYATNVVGSSTSVGDGTGSDAKEDCWGGSNLGFSFPRPKEICNGLDKFVIGQERAKKVWLLVFFSKCLLLDDRLCFIIVFRL